MKQIKTENDVKALVKEWFDKRDAWHFAPIQNGMGVHGIPDRIGCVPIRVTQAMVGKRIGLFVAVEAKAPGRRGEPEGGLSKHQVMQLRGIIDAKGVGRRCDGAMDLVALSSAIDRMADGWFGG